MAAATHVGIVWNPSKTTKDDLESALREVENSEAVTASWFQTTEEDPGGDATRRALDADVDVVIAAGGDGTVRAVAEHLAQTRAETELGIIPLGTGNLLARNLDIPLKDLTAAFVRALSGEPRSLDIGWAEVALADGAARHAFAVMAGFGIDAHMITETDEGLKDKAGWLAYVESLGRAISASDVIDIRVSLDGAAPVSETAHTVLVGNCGTLQGGLTVLPDADPADGKLDLLVLHQDGIAGWADTMRNMVWDNGLKRFFSPRTASETAESTESTSHRAFKSLQIDLAEPRVFEVDGDDLGETARVRIDIQPAAVRVR